MLAIVPFFYSFRSLQDIHSCRATDPKLIIVESLDEVFLSVSCQIKPDTEFADRK